MADLEANGLLDVADTVWCCVATDITTGVVHKFYPGSPEGYVDEMLKYFDTVDVLGFHNGFGFDFALLRKLFNYEYKGQAIDTLIMSRLLFPKRTVPKGCTAGPHSIESWGITFGMHKPENEDWSKFTEHMLFRCSEDVRIQCRLYHELIKKATTWKGATWWEPFKLTFNVFSILQRQEQMGWLVDRAYIDKSLHLLDHWINRIDKVLEDRLPLVVDYEHGKTKGELNFYKAPFTQKGTLQHYIVTWLDTLSEKERERNNSDTICGPFSKVLFRKVDLGKDTEVKDYLLSTGWIPTQWNYKKIPNTKQEMRDSEGKKIPTSPKLSHDDDFIGVKGAIGRLIARRVQCCSRRGILQGWVTVIRPDGRIPQVITGIANTGRLKHKNIVNVPNGEAFFGKQMRKIFICRKGFKIVGTDSSGCQLRMLAARMGDKEYTETILNGDKSKGTDIHSVNQRAAGLPSRGAAKRFIYGFLFGAGDAKIGSIVNGTAKEGKALKEKFLKGLPALGTLLNNLTAEWRKNAKRTVNQWGGISYRDGWVRGLDGRPIRIESEHMILVYMLQSDEAIMMQYALCFLYKWCCQRGWVHGVDYGFVANVHDEFQAEVREDIVDEYKALAERAITVAGEYLHIACKHEGEADVGVNWFETH